MIDSSWVVIRGIVAVREILPIDSKNRSRLVRMPKIASRACVSAYRRFWNSILFDAYGLPSKRSGGPVLGFQFRGRYFNCSVKQTSDIDISREIPNRVIQSFIHHQRLLIVLLLKFNPNITKRSHSHHAFKITQIFDAYICVMVYPQQTSLVSLK